MESYSLRHLPNEVLKRELFVVAGRESGATAIVIAHIGEFDSRELYLPAGYPSMYQYCLQELKFSEDEAFKRIEVARAAMNFPAIFAALAERRLHMTAVLKLAPHLDEANAATLLEEAEHKTKPQLEQLLATRFPRPDLPTLIQPLVSATQLAPERVALPKSAAQPGESTRENVNSPAPGRVNLPAPSAPVAPLPTHPRVTPLAPERFAVQLTISQSTREKMRRAQDLLGHAVPSGDLAKVLDRAFDALIEKLEKRKYGATDKPRCSTQRASKNSRYIPADVRRKVRQRDGDRCTFVGTNGKRCDERRGLEFDHWKEAARGGEASVANIRQRCRAHNQYAAEQTYGAEFMREKRRGGVEQSARRGPDAKRNFAVGHTLIASGIRSPRSAPGP